MGVLPFYADTSNKNVPLVNPSREKEKTMESVTTTDAYGNEIEAEVGIDGENPVTPNNPPAKAVVAEANEDEEVEISESDEQPEEEQPEEEQPEDGDDDVEDSDESDDDSEQTRQF